MDLLSGYSDAGINAFNANQNAIGNNLMNNISAQQILQQQQMAQWNATAAAASRPTPPGYGEVHLPYLSGSFGPAAAPGTYSPGSGRSSFSGTSLQPSYGGWGGMDNYLNDNPDVRQYAVDHGLNQHDFAYQHATTHGAQEGRNTYNAPIQSGGYPSGNVERGPDLQAPAWQDPFKSSSPWEGAGFDAIKYLNAPGNEDLKAANVNPWQHALQHGFSEHRQGMGWNPMDYLNNPANADLKAAGVNPWQHAQEHGFAEGRAGLEGLQQVGRDQLAKAMTAQQPKNPYAGMILGPGGNPSYFNPGTYAGDKGNYGIPFNGRPMAGDIGSQGNKNMPNLGYNPGMQNWFAPQSGANAYAPLGGAMQFPNSGTPSQYAPGAQMPPGFAGTYSADNQQGALPTNWQTPFGY